MVEPRPLRMIIGGGGISGLILANALEKAGIDYILLEARDTIAPQVGASIGFSPHGCRILDQLGCFDDIAQDTVPLEHVHNRYDDGSLIYTGDSIPLTQKRFFYPTTFVERETVLQTLYENLPDKSKIQVAKRVTKVDHNTNEIIVLCEDGTAVSGDILVGCDGTYSKVREELWRIGNMQDPTMFDAEDKDSVTAEYNCLFGISTATQHIMDGEVHVNYTVGSSTMIIGSKCRVFWFIFKRLDKVYTAPNIPRYTKLDAETFASLFRSSPITREVCFGDIWDNRTSYTLVATEEAQLKRWSWGRIACIGDSAHKMTPNLGQGGNTAIETAAALANELKVMVDNTEKGRPSFDNIVRHLGSYASERFQPQLMD